MCDYSLESYRTRPAQRGERYVTHRFPYGSIGLISAGDCETAVCMQPDTKLRLSDTPEDVQVRFEIGAVEEATFVRLDQGPHHDGVRLSNGKEMTLQTLRNGVSAEVTWMLGDTIDESRLVTAE